MIMAIDVSNTNITLGTFNGAKLLKIYGSFVQCQSS